MATTLMQAAAIQKAVTKPLIGNNEFTLWLWSVVLAQKVPGLFVEIGVQRARGMRALVQALTQLSALDRVIIGIDPSRESARHWKLRNEELKGALPERRLISDCSQNPDVIRKVGRDIAWLYVDGCHCFECVWADIDNWAPKVVPGGYLVFHDTRPEQWYNKRDNCFVGQRPPNPNKQPRRWGVTYAIEAAKEGMVGFAEILRVGEPNEAGLRIYRRT